VADVVFQLNVRDVLEPIARPEIVCVPIVTPAVASVKTQIEACCDGESAHVLDGDGDGGRVALRHDRGRAHRGDGEIRGGGACTMTPIASVLFAELLSTSFCVAEQGVPGDRDAAGVPAERAGRAWHPRQARQSFACR
jgi:hypothetical protein